MAILETSIEITDYTGIGYQPLKLFSSAAAGTHTLSEEATVLIVENRDATSMGLPEIFLGEGNRSDRSH